VDLLTSPEGVDFADAYERRIEDVVDGVRVAVISLRDLIANKRASGRKRDLADVEALGGDAESEGGR
jgi:predicted nucleotidyltransferase